MDERADHFRQLRWSLQALAASASDQLSVFPEWAVTADELALDFDQWGGCVLQNYRSELDDSQRAPLEAIAHTFARMSHDAVEFDADVWSAAALESSEQWDAIRRLAVEALTAFGWPAELPPVDRSPIADRRLPIAD